MYQNFSGQNLRGCSFKGQDLIGANFSYADIRGADFTNATLIGADFNHARAGLQPRWVNLSIAVSFLLLGGLGLGLGQFLAPIKLNPELLQAYATVPGAIVFVILGILFIITSQERFTAALVVVVMAVVGAAVVAGATVVAGAVSGAIATGVAWALAGELAVVTGRLRLFSWAVILLALALAGKQQLVETWLFVFICAAGGGFASSLAVDGALVLRLAIDKALTLRLVWALAGIWAFGWALASSVLQSGQTGALNWAVAVAIILVVILTVAVLGAYVSRQTLARGSRIAFPNPRATAFAAKGGTSFRDANLTDAMFTQATLKNTDLRAAILTGTRFENCHQLNYALLDNNPSMLALFRNSSTIAGTISSLLILWMFPGLLGGLDFALSWSMSYSPPPAERIASLRSGIFFQKILTGHAGPVSSVTFSSDAQTLASASLDKTAKVWDLKTGRLLHTFASGDNEYSHYNFVAISPNGHTLTNLNNPDLKLWDLRTGRLIRTFTQLLDRASSIAISPDGQFLAVATDEGKTIKLWHLRTGQLLRTLSMPTEVRNLEALSLDGQMLASSSQVASGKRNEPISTIQVWNLRTGQLARTLPAGYSRRLIFISSDKQMLATVRSAEDNPLELISQGKVVTDMVELWNLRTGELIRTFFGKLIESITISPDGQTLAISSGLDSIVKVWDLRTGQRLCTLSGSSFESVESITISPDGQFLATGSSDGTSKIWHLPRR